MKENSKKDAYVDPPAPTPKPWLRLPLPWPLDSVAYAFIASAAVTFSGFAALSLIHDKALQLGFSLLLSAFISWFFAAVYEWEWGTSLSVSLKVIV